MDPQVLDPIDMDGKCVNPHKDGTDDEDGRSSSECQVVDWGDCT